MAKVFLSSSNTAQKLFELGRNRPEHGEQLKAYAEELDIAVEAYVLGPTEPLFDNMLKELNHAKRLYKIVSGRELCPD